jgi:OHCU decarboxylase
VTVTRAELNAMPESEAGKLLKECCGASRWVSTMLSRRPFASRDAVFSAADEIWRSLGPSDWLEAFSHHPRIGEQSSAMPQTRTGSQWAASEQAGMQRANDQARDALAAANRAYEARFGYIYIVCATGKSADEMLSLARQRLRNDPDTELGVAAEEQRKITHLRLEKLLTS